MATPALQLRPNAAAVRPRRLLLITYHFPPDGAVGGLRWSGLSKYLARLGWEIHVVTAASGPAEPMATSIYRHPCARRRTLNDFYGAVATRLRKRRGSVPSPADAHVPDDSLRAASVLNKLRMAGRVALGFPDAGRGWVLRAGMTARRLMQQHEFDAVVSSGPPHSAHFAAVIATLGRRMPHIIDMRDPWRSANPAFLAYGMDPHWLHVLIGPFERLLFHHVRWVVTNTHEFAEELRQSQPQLIVSHVPNGTDVEGLPRRTMDRFEGVSIAYVGTFYAGRSFSTLFAAIEDLIRERPRDAARLTLRIAGHIDATQRELFRGELAARGIASMVEFHGSLPRPEALALLQRSHLALVLAQAQPTQIPAKLYECVGLEVPTLAITESRSATEREAHRIGALVCETGDTAAIRRILDELLDGRMPDRIPPATPISYESLAGQVDGLLRSMLGSVRGI